MRRVLPNSAGNVDQLPRQVRQFAPVDRVADRAGDGDQHLEHADQIRPRDDEGLFRLEVAHEDRRIVGRDHGRQQIRRPNDALMNVGTKPADITRL